ncbi:hypothetical protein E2C01_052162 [Portunus trituberculatus]|uniref:Uncharacterized protein n=1 Tax=Portunus trituberculatus TaxID=210409 RepID=A0A5B7GLM1_PORTR|nr:hypothetical protein [Portunus trituberculatus]
MLRAARRGRSARQWTLPLTWGRTLLALPLTYVYLTLPRPLCMPQPLPGLSACLIPCHRLCLTP